MIRLKYFGRVNLEDLINIVNEYCSRHNNVYDIKIFQRFTNGISRFGVEEFVAIIKEKYNDR